MQNNKLIDDATNKAKEIINDSKTVKAYRTGTMFENLFASMWLKMPLIELEMHRALLNKIIKEKIIKDKIIKSQKTNAGVK